MRGGRLSKRRKSLWVEGYVEGDLRTVQYPVPSICSGCAKEIDRVGNMMFLGQYKRGDRGINTPACVVYIPLCELCRRAIKIRDRWYMAFVSPVVILSGWAASEFIDGGSNTPTISLWGMGIAAACAVSILPYLMIRLPARMQLPIERLFNAGATRRSVWIRFRNEKFVQRVREMELERAAQDPLRYVMGKQR